MDILQLTQFTTTAGQAENERVNPLTQCTQYCGESTLDFDISPLWHQKPDSALCLKEFKLKKDEYVKLILSYI